MTCKAVSARSRLASIYWERIIGIGVTTGEATLQVSELMMSIRMLGMHIWVIKLTVRPILRGSLQQYSRTMLTSMPLPGSIEALKTCKSVVRAFWSRRELRPYHKYMGSRTCQQLWLNWVWSSRRITTGKKLCLTISAVSSRSVVLIT